MDRISLAERGILHNSSQAFVEQHEACEQNLYDGFDGNGERRPAITTNHFIHVDIDWQTFSNFLFMLASTNKPFTSTDACRCQAEGRLLKVSF
uniref:Uncharacterized protein n=1 Tax=Romanomermis culicivorax TaxID=13658 RepID=A0A915HTA0_ROMCU